MPRLSRTIAACALPALLAGGCAREIRRPNVVLIVVDTLRADHLGAYGYERDTSPNIDALARRSILFEHAISPASWTNPAMAAMFTGVAPDALGIGMYPVKLPPKLETLGEALQAAGYSTHGVVSHLYVAGPFGFDRGFDTWDEENALGHTHVSSPSVTDKALAALAAHDGPEPYFLFVHYFDPHYDYIEHERQRFSDEYDGKLVSAKDNIRRLRTQAAAGEFGPEDIQHLHDLYDSEIAFTDLHLGRLFAELERRGELEDALVILTADHGEALTGRPTRDIGHGRTLFGELIRVPLIIKQPGQSTGRVESSVVSTKDVFATLVDRLDLDDERGLAPASLLRAGDDTVFSATYFDSNLQAVRQGRWKLIHNTKNGRQRLFDLEADPGELDSRAGREPQVLARLERLRVEWSARNRAVQGLLSSEEPQLSGAQEEQLRLLGYGR